MTPTEKLARLRDLLAPVVALEKKATKAPWRQVARDRYVYALAEKCVAELPSNGVHHAKVDSANRDLIIAMRNALPALAALLAEGTEGT
jgi:hypothetical protein